MDITSAALATLISAITSAIVALLITNSNKKKSLDDQLDGILKIAIQFPYLESRDFGRFSFSRYSISTAIRISWSSGWVSKTRRTPQDLQSSEVIRGACRLVS